MTPKPPPVGQSLSLSPSPMYHLRGGDLFFLLGHILYRVHSYFFLRESAFWKRELIAPGDASEKLLKGNSSANAIILEEDPKDFDRFLWVFYNDKIGDFSAPLQDWITIMRYATRWDFPFIKDLAIQHLENHEMDPIDRIKLYQENNLPEKYLFPLYVRLASREELLGIEESRTLGLETLVLIQQARERLRAPKSPMGDKLLSPIRTDLKQTDIFDIVSATFNISFGEVPVEPKSGSPITKEGLVLIPPKEKPGVAQVVGPQLPLKEGCLEKESLEGSNHGWETDISKGVSEASDYAEWKNTSSASMKRSSSLWSGLSGLWQ